MMFTSTESNVEIPFLVFPRFSGLPPCCIFFLPLRTILRWNTIIFEKRYIILKTKCKNNSMKIIKECQKEESFYFVEKNREYPKIIFWYKIGLYIK